MEQNSKIDDLKRDLVSLRSRVDIMVDVSIPQIIRDIVPTLVTTADMATSSTATPSPGIGDIAAHTPPPNNDNQDQDLSSVSLNSIDDANTSSADLN